MWEKLLETYLKRTIRTGALAVTLPSGRVIRAGEGGDPIHVALHDPTLARRIVLTPDLGVGEGYMDGSLTIAYDDLRGLLALAVSNTWQSGHPTWRGPLAILRRARNLLRQYTPVSRARANVAHHYDLSGQLYDLFLDTDKQYSCGYFRHADASLEQAQTDKKAHIAAKLMIEPGMRVLDIGCGWGGMALSLAQDHGAEVVGVTLSREQHAIATNRAREAGLGDRIDIRFTDYREVEGQFDRIVSVGMFEHVGAPHYDAYFRTVRDRLTPEGVALIHTIGRSAPPGATSPWIDKYIFPGGYVPSLSEMSAAIERQRLIATDIEIWRLHYAETLRHWHDRFMANIDRARALYDDRFCRMWRFYLLASEMTFRFDAQVVFQTQIARQIDSVPITRDYITEPVHDGAARTPLRRAGHTL